MRTKFGDILLEAKLVKKGDSSALELTFDESLSHLMRSLTREHIGHQLAIIVEGKIVAAPRINSPIGSKAVLEGTFTTEQLERLEKWLRAAQTAAPQTVAPNDLGAAPKTPAPTFNGHTLDEWLALLQTEQSAKRTNQAAIAMIEWTSNRTEFGPNSVRVTGADRKSEIDYPQKSLNCCDWLLGPDAYGSGSSNNSNKNDERIN